MPNVATINKASSTNPIAATTACRIDNLRQATIPAATTARHNIPAREPVYTMQTAFTATTTKLSQRTLRSTPRPTASANPIATKKINWVDNTFGSP